MLIRLLGASLAIASTAAAAQPTPVGSPFLSEEQVLNQLLYKNSGQAIKATVMPHLQTAYPTVTLRRLFPLIELPLLGVPRRARDEDAALKAIPSRVAGVTFLAEGPMSVTFAVDWTKAPVEVVIQPGATISSYLDGSSLEFLGYEYITPPISKPVRGWNCSPKTVPLERLRVETESTTRTDTEERETTKTEVVSTQVGIGDGAAKAFLKPSVKWDSTVVNRFKTSTSIGTTTGTEDRFTYTVPAPPFSSVLYGRSVRTEAKRWKLSGKGVFDVDLAVTVPAMRFSAGLGPWSGYAAAADRSLPAESHVRVVSLEVEQALVVPTSYGTEAECVKAYNQAEMGGGVAPTFSGDEALKSLAGMMEAPTAATSAAVFSNAARDLARTATAAAPADASAPPVNAKCEAAAAGAVDYNAGTVYVSHAVHITSCPHPNYSSTGRFLFELDVVRTNGRADTLRGFEGKWTSEAGQRFTVKTTERLNPNDIEKVVGVRQPVQFTDCQCRAR